MNLFLHLGEEKSVPYIIQCVLPKLPLWVSDYFDHYLTKMLHWTNFPSLKIQQNKINDSKLF